MDDLDNFRKYNKQFPVTDYHDWTYRSTPKKKRKQLSVGDIYLNAAICKKCDYFIRSRNRHDMVYCKCGTVAVDGGSFYQKITGYTQAIIITEYYDDVNKEAREKHIEVVSEKFADRICYQIGSGDDAPHEYDEDKAIIREQLIEFYKKLEDDKCQH